MPLIVVAAAAAVAAALPLLWWGVAGVRTPSPRAAVSRNLSASTNLRDLVLTRSAGERAVQPLLEWLAARGRRLTPAGHIAMLDQRLVLAGRPAAWPLDRVLAAKLLLTLGGLATALLVWFSLDSGLRLPLAAALPVFGYFAPDLIIWSRGKERQERIQLELPDTLDQMTISVEAGLGFEAAMARCAANGSGPLAAELKRTLQEMQVGARRSDALRALAGRTTVRDLRHFVLAVQQAETYGVPIAEVLRTQSAEMRMKRRQRAEERAMKIPVKIVFPLVLCILPTLFVVLLGPAVIRIGRTLLDGAL